MNQPDGRGTRVLVVDDQEPVLFTIRRYLSTLGYQVICAREREEAEALLAHSRFDLVITDLNLTVIQAVEGLELIAFLKANFPHTRIVLLTAYGTPAIELEARRLGVDGLLDKSQPLSAMAAAISTLLEARR
jgi:CheY-like chemotaxis protein